MILSTVEEWNNNNNNNNDNNNNTNIMGAFPCEACSIALNMCKYKNKKHMYIRLPKQHVSKQSCSNIQLSSKDWY